MRMLLALSMIIAFPLLAEPVVIGHGEMTALDRTTLQRIYTGKVVEVNGLRITPVDLNRGHRLRQRFLELYLGQDDEQYIGYWTVRRYVGKGSPPREFESVQDIIQYVTQTRGAIGYIDESDLKTGVNVLSRPY